MSDVLGHDIDGRPLRAGDAIVLTALNMEKEFVGEVHVIVGPAHSDWLEPDEPEVGLDDGYDAQCRTVKRLGDEHLPAPESFEQIMQGLRGVPV